MCSVFFKPVAFYLYFFFNVRIRYETPCIAHVMPTNNLTVKLYQHYIKTLINIIILVIFNKKKCCILYIYANFGKNN